MFLYPVCPLARLNEALHADGERTLNCFVLFLCGFHWVSSWWDFYVGWWLGAGDFPDLTAVVRRRNIVGRGSLADEKSRCLLHWSWKFVYDNIDDVVFGAVERHGSKPWIGVVFGAFGRYGSKPWIGVLRVVCLQWGFLMIGRRTVVPGT